MKNSSGSKKGLSLFLALSLLPLAAYTQEKKSPPPLAGETQELSPPRSKDASSLKREKQEPSSSLQAMETYTHSLKANGMAAGYLALSAQIMALMTKALGFKEKDPRKLTPEGYQVLQSNSFEKLWNDFNIKAKTNEFQGGNNFASRSAYEVLGKNIPWVYGAHHLNALSNLIAPFAQLAQAFSTTYYAFKIKRELNSFEKTTKMEEQLKKINSQLGKILTVQWTGTVLSLLTFSASSTYTAFLTHKIGEKEKGKPEGDSMPVINRFILLEKMPFMVNLSIIKDDKTFPLYEKSGFVGFASGVAELFLTTSTTYLVRTLTHKLEKTLQELHAPQK